MRTLKRLTLATLLLMAAAGTATAQEVHRWWVRFADKAGSPYTLESPSEYLGPRALERRARLGVGIDSTDLPVSPAYTDALRREGYRIWAASRWLNGVLVYTSDSSSVDATLRALPGVEGVEYYGVGSLTRTEIPDWTDGMPVAPQPYDSLYTPEYYGLGYDNINTLNGIGLHRAGYEGQGLLVGVCDGGFSGADTLEVFSTLRSEGRLVAVRDFVYGGDRVFDLHSHGTRVLTNLAADVPGLYVGTAPKAAYILCRTEDLGGESPVEEYLWAAAMEYMDSLGVDVVNTSLGYLTFDDTRWDHPAEALDGQTAPMTRAANAASTRGILVVVSAGNNGIGPGPSIGAPADSPLALVVGAIGHDGQRTPFSSHGPTADGRIKPDVMALGQDVWVVNPDGTLEEVRGTSFSSPIMAGMAACMVQRYPTLDPTAWADSLRAWGNLASHPLDDYGYGVPDFGLALRGGPTLNIDGADGNVPRLYPNPATDCVEIVGDDGRPASRVEVFDALGRRLLFLDSPTRRIDLSLLPRGTYLLRLTSPTASHTARIVKL